MSVTAPGGNATARKPVKLREWQERAMADLRAAMREVKSVILVAPTGCHRIGQGIRMADWSAKPVESIMPGEQVMGWDGTPRTVLSLCRGHGRMYRIIPKKGEPFVVNEDHILTLMRTKDGTGLAGEVVDVSVRDYLGWSQTRRHIHKLFRRPLCGSWSGTLPIDPYFLGVLLGDGCLTGTMDLSVTKPDPEIRAVCEEQAAKWGARIVVVERPGVSGPNLNYRFRAAGALWDALGRLRLDGARSGTKFVPNDYLRAQPQQRRELLAGLLDTDGHHSNGGYDYISKSRRLAEDVVFLARSVGLAAYMKPCEKRCQNGTGGTYYRVSISGNTEILPLRIPRKQPRPRRMNKDVLCTGFTVESLPEEEDFYGFTLTGDGRYLMEDFTVTHNSGKGTLVAELIYRVLTNGKRVLFIVRGRQLVSEFSARLTEQYGVEHQVIMAGLGHNPHWPISVASIDTLASMVRRGKQLPTANLIILDECDQSISPSFDLVLKHYRTFTLGVTATPVRADGKGLGRRYDRIIIGSTPRALIDAGQLADFDGLAFESELTDDELAQSRRSDAGMERVYEGLSESRREARRGHLVEEWHRHVGTGAKRADGTPRPHPAPTVGFAITRADSREIVDRFNAERVKGAPVCVAAHLDGDVPLKERERIHEAMRQGEVHLVSSVGVMGRGVDWPVLECAALWRPTGSLAWHLQACGRVLRTYSGHRTLMGGWTTEPKQRAFFLDHVGNFARHGLPDELRDWSLDDGAVAASEGEKLSAVAVCQKCKAQHLSRRPCPRCGHLNAPEERELPSTTLKAVAVDIRAAAKQETRQDEAALRRHLYVLRQVARKRGQGDEWAVAVWRKQHSKVHREELARIAESVVGSVSARLVW